MRFKPINEGIFDIFKKNPKKVRLCDFFEMWKRGEDTSIKSVYYYLIGLAIKKNNIKPEREYLTREEIEKKLDVSGVLKDEEKSIQSELKAAIESASDASGIINPGDVEDIMRSGHRDFLSELYFKKVVSSKKLYKKEEFERACLSFIPKYIDILKRGYYRFALAELLEWTFRKYGVEVE